MADGEGGEGAGGEGNGEGNDPPVFLNGKTEAEVESYIKKLRTEASNYRLKAKEATEGSAAKLAEMQASLDRAIAEAKADAEARVKHALLTTEAIKAGMIDVSDLAVLDTSTVALDGNKLAIPEGFWDAAKAAKGHLFGSGPTLSGPASPAPGEPKPIDARVASRDDARAAAAKLGISPDKIR